MHEEDKKPPLPSSSPPEPAEPNRTVTFSLSCESPINTATSFFEEFERQGSYNPNRPRYGLFVSPGIPLVPTDPLQTHGFTNSLPTARSWPEQPEETSSEKAMIVEEATRTRSVANSLDSLSDDVINGNNGTNGDRSRSLGDLLVATSSAGSYDTLLSKLADSGIGGGLMRDDQLSSPERNLTTDTVSSPDSFSYPAVLFSSYDPTPGGFSNENANPALELREDRKNATELPAISEESEHEQSIHVAPPPPPPPPAASASVVELSYPMQHCTSAPNPFAANHVVHRRVVSDDVSEMTRLKRSEEIENMDKIGRLSFEKGGQSLKKGRCKSAMLVFHDKTESSEEEDNTSEESTKDIDLLIADKNNDVRKSLENHSASSPISTEPPPVRLPRKGSALSGSSSWKDKMPPFALAGHTMYSPQSLPSRDVVPRTPFDIPAGTISGGSHSPLALMATVDVIPLSDLCNRFSTCSSIHTELNSDDTPPPSSRAKSPYSSFMSRGLKNFMRRTSMPPSMESKRRGSSMPNSFLSTAEENGRTRAKSLKKQRLGKANKKEKSGSDTFTFGNLFRKKQPTSRPNLADIISDLDQRSTSATAGGNRRSTSTTTLPMADPTAPFESSSLDGLPDHISRMVSPAEHNYTTGATTSPSTSLYLNLDRMYGKYDLFGKEEYQSWHEKYRHNALSTKQVKKQDAIYELFLMEKRHCANIAFLHQGYRKRMLDENIISQQDMDILIPDVLEPLLMFHLNVLERMIKRLAEDFEVITISDIICEELAIDGGQHTKICCDAYTDFGVGKERSDVLYHQLMNKNQKFADFFKRTYASEEFYKHFEFRPLITKIIGRATKYSLLLETILKNEQPFSGQHDLTKAALETARAFAHRIDENLSVAHMSMKWEECKGLIDPASSTNLYVSDPSVAHNTIRYHFDLDSLNSAPNRKLVHLTEAFIKTAPPASGGTHSSSSSSSSSAKMDHKTACFLVLFDDIIVILCRKSANRLVFMQDQGAIPVQSLLIRPSARGHSIMLISGAKPILFEISFHTSTERKKWVAHLEAAPKNVPRDGVRISTPDADGVLRERVVAQQESENRWMDELERIFASRYAEEETLSNYLETRLQFFDDVRAHMQKLPFKSRNDISSRIREAVKGKFRELRRARVIPLNRLVERMAESRDADLWSFFDEKADCSDVLERSSDLSDDSSNSGDSGAAASATRGAKPRRIQTFHGTSQPTTTTMTAAAGATDEATPKNGGIRRHTTVPRMNSDGGGGSGHSSNTTDRPNDELVDGDDETAGSSARARGASELDRKAYGEMVAELPIRQTMRARRASTKLIKEVISLRRENHNLRSENALTKSRCALLERVRGGGGMMSSTASAVDESMEMLRRKEKEIREMQRVMTIERDELLEKQKAVEAQEAEIQSKWAALQVRSAEVPVPPVPVVAQHSRSSSQVSSPTYKTPPIQNSEWSPVLASLATKTETKKLKNKSSN